MTKSTIGQWGKSLAVRLPADVVRAAGLSKGAEVECTVENGTVVIHPGRSEETIRKAREAGARILARSRGVRLDGLSIREMLDEGRRGE
ncbi:AbrB/MazE/SpoVT family DNA-binding domain-containing protein [Salinarimonas rosea]|uniref:AbrB/MazE/SpoVT family DNA-binding domain-containing protein n=1 Tax=Salinarimonas rosea TaxID=552063 RepID=UPI0004161E32|nr:AbrB/MazE/SpoVT family DNA-binding domain-containing protein [Salinarimonas rosea]